MTTQYKKIIALGYTDDDECLCVKIETLDTEIKYYAGFNGEWLTLSDYKPISETLAKELLKLNADLFPNWFNLHTAKQVIRIISDLQHLKRITDFTNEGSVNHFENQVRFQRKRLKGKDMLFPNMWRHLEWLAEHNFISSLEYLEQNKFYVYSDGDDLVNNFII